MNERRPSATETASSTSTKKSGYIFPPRADDVEDGALFDAHLRPTVEMDRALAGDEFWANTARSAIIALAETHESFTADELHAAGVPMPTNRNMIGAAFSAAARDDVIEHYGYRKSRRPERNGSVVSVWRRKR
jgi:hypothetical protein